MLPFLFSALSMNAVGRAAMSMIEEVRRQFREIPGLREGKPGGRRPKTGDICRVHYTGYHKPGGIWWCM